MSFLKRHIGILIVLFLSFWAVRPLFAPGFFPMHDDTQVARVFEMGKMLSRGIFPVRWVPDLGYGYGYPIFNFYAPLAYYVGGILTLVGFDALIATKLMMGIGILLSGVFMYLLAREFWGEPGGIISGLFYVYAPYHALDIYVRGDVAEFWAYAFVPLIFLGFYKVFYSSPSRSRFATPRRWQVFDLDSFEVDVGSVWKWITVGSFGYAAVILSHNLTAMMVTPLLAIVILLYYYIGYKKNKLFIIHYSLFIILLGLATSAFYWIPALLEMKYTNVLSQIGGGADFRDHFVCIQQLWSSPWGFGGSAPGCIDGLSFKIGKLHILLAALTACFLILTQLFRKKGTLKQVQHDTKISVWFSIFGLLISIFLMLEISKPIWQTIPQMAFFQYPWRFLLLASFFSSLLSGAIVWLLTIYLGGVLRLPPRWVTATSFVILIFWVIYFNSKFFQPQTIALKTAGDYTNEYALKWTASKISDEYMPRDFKKPKSEYEIAKEPAILPQETAVQKISNIISMIGVLALIIGIIKFRRRLAINE